MTTNLAAYGNTFATELLEITDDLSVLDDSGKWFVAGWFAGPVLAFKFANWSDEAPMAGSWVGPSDWYSDMDAPQYVSAVEAAREEIAQGNVYEVNICRRIRATWPDSPNSDSFSLYLKILQEHPAEHAAYLRLSDVRLESFGLPANIEIISASPELFLRRMGSRIESAPIKGTAPTDGDFLDKDVSENIMIVDLVRNDLSAVSKVASVHVPKFLQRHEIPGISHLVTTVAAELKPEAGWQEIFEATFPPGSVTGAPKSSALRIIDQLESPRNIYCGTMGYVDVENQQAELSVTIRTFWREDDDIVFGTGAGITWGSDALQEWQETELKAAKLIGIASSKVSAHV
ncbi:MAG: hypothetical protein RL038_1061 [Actinomycetota bacterium]|jgi:para-aminobenzoate synthetase component 1